MQHTGAYGPCRWRGGWQLMKRVIALGVDSSTQSTKVVAVDVDSGEELGIGRSSHSGENIQDPNDWWEALRQAVREVVEPSFEVAAIAVAAQQHGLVTIGATGEPVRPAPVSYTHLTLPTIYSV